MENTPIDKKLIYTGINTAMVSLSRSIGRLVSKVAIAKHWKDDHMAITRRGIWNYIQNSYFLMATKLLKGTTIDYPRFYAGTSSDEINDEYSQLLRRIAKETESDMKKIIPFEPQDITTILDVLFDANVLLYYLELPKYDFKLIIPTGPINTDRDIDVVAERYHQNLMIGTLVYPGLTINGTVIKKAKCIVNWAKK